MTPISPKHLRTFTCTDDDWETFCSVVKETDPEVSASHAIRELMRWYAGGCGKLRLEVPLRYPPPSGTV